MIKTEIVDAKLTNQVYWLIYHFAFYSNSYVTFSVVEGETSCKTKSFGTDGYRY